MDWFPVLTLPEQEAARFGWLGAELGLVTR